LKQYYLPQITGNNLRGLDISLAKKKKKKAAP